MQTELFCLCDAATADAGGKVNILGAFDTLSVERVPAMHPQCAVALRIRFDPIERGMHEVKVNIVDNDGGHVIPPLQGKVEVRFPDGEPSGSINLILGLQGLRVTKLGAHSIDLAVDRRQEASLPLYVKERRKQA